MTSSDRTHPASPAGDVVVRNPYRVLGLPGEARWSEIRSAAERLLDAPDPSGETTPWDLSWLDPLPRTEADVERALTRLADPNLRLRDRLFWFHERVAETAVYELTPATIRNALEGWSATSQPLARHDAAVVALIAAIALDPAVEKSAIWRRAVEEWEEALTLEAYWLDVLRLEMEGGFEDPASLADVREIRERGTRLVTEPLLGYAREAVIAEDLPRAARILAVLRETLPEEVFENRCGDLAEHVWGSFDADWSPDARKEPLEPTDDSTSRAGAIDTQNPALWDFAADEEEAPAEPGETEAHEAMARMDEPGPSEGGAEPDEPGPSEPPEPESSEPPAGPDEPAVVVPPPATPSEPPPTPSEPPPTPDAATAPDEAPPGASPATEPSSEAPDTAPVDERPAASDEPGPAPARTRPRTDDRVSRWRRRPGPLPLIAAVVALVVVTLAALLPRLRSGAEAGATPADATVRRDVERRMDTIDAALAEALVDRVEIDEEIGLLRESVEGYQTLVDDYERRMARRLPADREAYRRVVGLRDDARRRLEAALADRRAVEERIDRIERIGSDLIAEWNAVGDSDAGDTERLPSPR